MAGGTRRWPPIASGAAPEEILPGAHLFVWARCAYVLVYVLGITYVRTLIWAASVVGLFWIASAAL